MWYTTDRILLRKMMWNWCDIITSINYLSLITYSTITIIHLLPFIYCWYHTVLHFMVLASYNTTAFLIVLIVPTPNINGLTIEKPTIHVTWSRGMSRMSLILILIYRLKQMTYEGPFLYSESDREIGRLSDSIDWDCVHNKVWTLVFRPAHFWTSKYI